MTALSTAGIAYNDGKIKFSVPFGRPADQHNQAPTGGNTYEQTDSDPVGEALKIQQFMFDRYGVNISRAVMSRKVANSMMNSDRWLARFVPVVGGTPSSPIDPNYLGGFSPTQALNAWQAATNIQPIVYDAVYRTRAIGGTTFVNNRFFPENVICYMPSESDLDSVDDTEIGFAKTLTSPHPEGNWTPGFYEWEQDRVDPWGRVRGTGVKAFPVFMHMDKTYTAVVLP
jgi:hypothetical protein